MKREERGEKTHNKLENVCIETGFALCLNFIT